MSKQIESGINKYDEMFQWSGFLWEGFVRPDMCDSAKDRAYNHNFSHKWNQVMDWVIEELGSEVIFSF